MAFRFENIFKVRWALVAYDSVIFALIVAYIVTTYSALNTHSLPQGLILVSILLACILFCRCYVGVYRMVLRYGGVQCYLALFISDIMGLALALGITNLLPFHGLSFRRAGIICALNLLAALFIRLVYRYAFRNATLPTARGTFLRSILRIFAGAKIVAEKSEGARKISIAILGAGRLGSLLAEELLGNDSAYYKPVCFIDADAAKHGRQIMGIPVVPEGILGVPKLKDMEVQEIVFAVTELSDEKKDFLYKLYKKEGYKVKVYDFPMQDLNHSGKRALREFDIEELLFRKQIFVNNELTKAFYKDKVVLITGGGGSIGSELCRQMAKMEPKQVIILDVYENGVYDVQQELRLGKYPKIDLRVEICSICNKTATERVFATYHPDIVIHAAAHKHVPLMEHNCIEAVENNVFGTLNVIELCEQYHAQRFMMVSTDKAVNPTNVMGATKRMCEIIAKAHSESGTSTTFSMTRFGNVLGSAGSVIPLFKRQITNGGPVTLTDKRIIRYFMTIPEASQLVLESGAMAKNGELFVLDMGKPIKILELAENMIRLMGLEPYKDIDIIETGLRPGEKLYEELLVKSDTLTTTGNNLIFVEKDDAIPMDELQRRLNLLQDAIAANDDDGMKLAMRKAVPTYKKPEEVNKTAEESKEMQAV